jgi:hypothetical protein
MRLADIMENILSPSPNSPSSVVGRALLPPKGVLCRSGRVKIVHILLYRIQFYLEHARS